MLPEKKREDHAGEPEGDGESERINFAWIVFVGMEIGYREQEIAHMYLGKWCDLFEEYKKMHNIRMQRMIFTEKKVQSLMDL